MNSDAIVTLVILAGTIGLFVTERVRADIAALCSLVALMLTGVLDVGQALGGFSSPAVLTLAGLFVVGAGLTETGVADWIALRLERSAGEGEARITAMLMSVTALFSALMSSTGCVAILLPVAGTLARQRGLPPGRLLMPLAFAAHLGSYLTLISTPPNLVVSEALRAAGHEPFRFFSFTAPGSIILVIGVAYMVLIGRRRLTGGAEQASEPARRGLQVSELAAEYGLAAAMRAVRIPRSSSLVGRSLSDLRLRTDLEVTVVGIIRQGAFGPETLRVVPGQRLQAGDELRLLGTDEAVAHAVQSFDLEPLPRPDGFTLPPEESLAEVVLPRLSRLAGRSLRAIRFRDRYRATVLALKRANGDLIVLHASPEERDPVLRSGDTLLLKGRRRSLRNLRDRRDDLLVLAESEVRTDVPVDLPRAIGATVITLGMLVVMAAGLLDSVVAVLAAAVALVLTGCVRPADIYRTVNWESLVVIACVVPLASALEVTGLLASAIGMLERLLTGTGTLPAMALLVVSTSAIGMVLSNTATAVLMAPIAVRLAEALSLSPASLLMGVAFAASAAFATPIASPVNMMVVGPGGYRFRDFLRVGVPLQLVILAVIVVVVPIFVK